MGDPIDVRLTEELAMHAWPAAESEPLDGWWLRFNHGVTRRSNSVWPNHGEGRLPTHERIARAEAFYAARGLQPRFQLTPAAVPGDLDARLAERGYRIEESTHVQVARTREVAERATARCPVEIAPDSHDVWTATAWPAPADRADVRRPTVERIEPETAFALARLDGEPAGVALGVAERGRVGGFCFHTLPSARRRGVAGALLGALARWGLERDCGQFYLQVEDRNTGARALYAGAGFETAYRYHYRMFSA
jgi:GNAT superfamily N-acetyltransferase